MSEITGRQVNRRQKPSNPSERMLRATFIKAAKGVTDDSKKGREQQNVKCYFCDVPVAGIEYNVKVKKAVDLFLQMNRNGCLSARFSTTKRAVTRATAWRPISRTGVDYFELILSWDAVSPWSKSGKSTLKRWRLILSLLKKLRTQQQWEDLLRAEDNKMGVN